MYLGFGWLGVALALGVQTAAVSAPVDFEKKWKESVQPFFEKGIAGRFEGIGKRKVAFRSFFDPKSVATVVIFPGLNESSWKYPEWIYDLSQRGYSVFILDLPGMGESERALKNPQITHIPSFSHYTKDALTFVETIVRKQTGKQKLFLFGHSTGGLVAAQVLAENRALFEAAVLSAPLFEMQTAGFPEALAYAFVKKAIADGLGEEYAQGSKDVDVSKLKFDTNVTTQSAERFDQYVATLKAKPELRMGGPSNIWVKEALDSTQADVVEALGKKVATPVLLFQAGKDELVKPTRQKTFCDAAASCDVVKFEKARHEIYREVDDYRDESLKLLKAFFVKYGG